MNPYYEHKGITIYHGDCLDILPHLPKVDLVLTDPPYGINWRPRINHRAENHLWHDETRPDLTPFLNVGTEHCFWGGQYFSDILPVSECWFCWTKRPMDFDFNDDKRSYSTIELAWSNFKSKPAFYNQVWDGGKRAGKSVNRKFLHPSQKPVELMMFVLSRSKTKGILLDPFMGSGTTLEAAKELGRRAIGIEIEEKYCEIAAKRLSQEVLPL